MLARRLRLLLRVRERKALLRINPRIVNLNLKASTSSQRLQLSQLNRSSYFYTDSARNYSTLSEVCNQTQNDEPDDQSVDGESSTSLVSENRYAYEYMMNNPRYSKTIIPPIIPDEEIPQEKVEYILNKEYITPLSISELIEDFRILSYHARPNRTVFTERHTKLLSALKDSVKNMVDDQIFLLLRYIEMWYPILRKGKQEALKKLEDELDHECWKRALDWDAEDLLRASDLFYHLRRSRESKLILYVTKKLGLKPQKMSAENYIQYMFMLNTCRKPSINMYELEYRLENLLETYTAEELSIIAMGFFKTQTPIRNPVLVKHIIQKCGENIMNLGNIFLCAAFKMARQSVHLRDRAVLTNFFQRFRSRIPSASTITLVHAAHAGATCLFQDKKTMNMIMEEVTRRGIANERLKDLERLVFALMTFNYPKTHPLYDMIAEQLVNPARENEIKKFSHTFSCALMYLSMANCYPLEIITKIMDHEYIRKVYKNNAFRVGREYLALECGLKIEVPEYKGAFLPERIYNYIAKKHAADAVWREDPSQRVQTYQKFLFEVTHYLKQIVGEKNYYIDQVLPHYRRADIILCLDREDKFVEPQPMLDALPTFHIKPAPHGYKWFALVLATFNHTFYASSEMTGPTCAKFRQLEILGYKPITLTLPNWNKQTEEEKPEVLRELVMKNIVDNK